MARAHGAHVLAVRPSGADTGLSFAALIDLCDRIRPESLAALPAPQRAALEVALLRAEPGAKPPEPQAIAVGLRTLLRELAEEAPVLIAIDDLQWLDGPSADALVFAARRLDDEPVSFLLARRPGRPSPLESSLERGGLERLRIGPLSLGATRRLLIERIGLSLPRPLLRRIVESTLGNPLFALELGRTLMEQGVPPAGEDLPVPDAVEDLLGTRVARLPEPARRLLLAVALSGDLHLDELAVIEGPEAVEDAIETGLLRVDGERARVSHPLLAAAAKQRSRRQEQRELHRALAGVVADERLRALHLARATERPDEELAGSLTEAACDALSRGARQQAVSLAEHALRLTPRESPKRPERLLDLAEYLERTGEKQRLMELLIPAIPQLPAGALRARGWLLLSDGASKTVPEIERHLDLALAEESDEPVVRTNALATRSSLAINCSVARLRAAEDWALEALELAPQVGRDAERMALYALGWARAIRGLSIDDLCARSGAATDAGSYIVAAPERVAGQRHIWRGELSEARAVLGRLLALADERSEPASYALQRLHMCELELRAGDWPSVARRLDEWEETDADFLIRPMYQRCHALLAAGLGLPEESERWAADAIARAETVGCRWDWLETRRAQGMAALLAREPARAAEHLRPVWEHTEREGVEPGVFPAAPDLVEALVELEALDEALAVADRVREHAERCEHPWGLVTAKRCRAVVRLASGYDEAAASALGAAAGEYRRLGLGFDWARTLLCLGRAQRRYKQWGAARESLEAAAAAFDELGSGGWAELARADLARVGGRKRRADGELTPTERDVVELAAEGLANKEIAQRLSLAVHTVEVHLSRAYAQLGVTSRAQLAGRLPIKP